VILAGRRINDGMGGYVARELVKEMIRRGVLVKGARVLVMGLAFKENTPDLRNTRVIDIVQELADYGCGVDVWDPWIAAADGARDEYGLDWSTAPAPAPTTAWCWLWRTASSPSWAAARLRALEAGAVLFDVKALPAGRRGGPAPCKPSEPRRRVGR
jgi:UDP-N-acetyl-D-galactosamine dehydrogenase